jgi:16S rRNA (uracil1498-N3)-methyltransferase
LGARRLFVPADQLAGPTVTLAGSEHHHLATVLRARPGDTVTLFDGTGGEVEARVLRVDRERTQLALGARRSGPVATAATTLLCAIPRGPRMDLLVQKTVELGVAAIVPLLTARSVARPEPARRERWASIAREAARQCGRADLPLVAPPTSLADALADRTLPVRRFALFEREPGQGLGQALAAAGEPAPTALLVGPEGGFEPAERDLARAAGFVGVGLGSRILRVETAAIVAVALTAAAHGDLG